MFFFNSFAGMSQPDCTRELCFLCQHSLTQWRSLIATRKSILSFKKGKKIFREGDPVKGIFFIYKGSIKVSKNWGGQKELILRFAKEGGVLGFRGFGGEPVYPISATALEDCTVCFIDNDFLELSLIANGGLTYHLLQLYASELQKTEKRMRDLVLREVKDRIVLALVEISDAFGTGEDDYLALPISRQDIASYAGTTYETVFKFFTELSAKNILTTSGKQIRINDHTALQQMIKELE
jgi:CRP/FNR family transcriptional regulator